MTEITVKQKYDDGGTVIKSIEAENLEISAPDTSAKRGIGAEQGWGAQEYSGSFSVNMSHTLTDFWLVTLFAQQFPHFIHALYGLVCDEH